MKKKKLLPVNYFLDHPFTERPVAATVMLYEYDVDSFRNPERDYEEVLGKKYVISESEQEDCDQIAAISSEKELFRWMRKTTTGKAKQVLLEKMLEMEDTTNRIIEKHLPVSRVDLFYENCVMYMLYSSKNYCSWIQEHWNEFSEDYVRSILSLVLGVRGDPSMVPFLMEKVEELDYWDKECYEQGPLLALERLQERFE